MKKIVFFLFPLFFFIVRLWWRTLRYRIVGKWRYTRLRDKKQPIIFVLWHDEIFSVIPLHVQEKIAAVVSQSKDGEILSRVLAKSGFFLARGSNYRGGLEAMRQAMRYMKKGSDVVFTADGPRGPRHCSKTGPVYLAARSGAVLLPIRVRLARAWKIQKAWDKFQVPLPFSHCEIRYGLPLSVPQGRLTEKELGQEIVRLENAMRALE